MLTLVSAAGTENARGRLSSVKSWAAATESLGLAGLEGTAWGLGRTEGCETAAEYDIGPVGGG